MSGYTTASSIGGNLRRQLFGKFVADLPGNMQESIVGIMPCGRQYARDYIYAEM